MDFVKIGKIVNTFGIKGELKIESLTDFVSDRFLKDTFIYIGDEKTCLIVNSYRVHKGFLLVSFKDMNDINLVQQYKNMYIYKNKSDIKPLDDGKYFFSDLKNLNVYVENKLIGKVLYVEQGISCNYLRIKINDYTKLVPFIPNFIKKVDLKDNSIHINTIEGLL